MEGQDIRAKESTEGPTEKETTAEQADIQYDANAEDPWWSLWRCEPMWSQWI